MCWWWKRVGGEACIIMLKACLDVEVKVKLDLVRSYPSYNLLLLHRGQIFSNIYSFSVFYMTYIMCVQCVLWEKCEALRYLYDCIWKNIICNKCWPIPSIVSPHFKKPLQSPWCTLRLCEYMCVSVLIPLTVNVCLPHSGETLEGHFGLVCSNRSVVTHILVGYWKLTGLKRTSQGTFCLSGGEMLE